MTRELTLVVVHRNNDSEFIDLAARAERVLLVDDLGEPAGASAGATIAGTVNDHNGATTVRAIDANQLIAEGRFLDRFIVNKFGRNSDVTTGGLPETIWGGGGLYTGFPAGAAEAVRVTSSDADDTAAGAGARSVYIEGLDADWNVQSEVIATAGLAAAVSVNTYRRVNRAYAVTAGATGTNEGTITIRHNVTTANIFALILPTFGQSKQAVYTIPAGYTGYLHTLGATIVGTGTTARYAEVALSTREQGGARRIRYPFSLANAAEYVRDFLGGVQLPEMTDMEMRTLDVSSTLDITGFFDLVLVRN